MTYATTPATTIETLEDNMVFVEGGKFTRGSGEETHVVSLDSFYLCRYPVTQALWKAVMGSDPVELTFSHPLRPVESVSWDNCQKLISKINSITNKTYRLPTEAEWEYAARGGKYSKGFTYAGSNNPLEVGWYEDNSQSITQPLGLKRPNELGLFDMSGNAADWCEDWYNPRTYLEYAENIDMIDAIKNLFLSDDFLNAVRNFSLTRVVHNPTGPQNGTMHIIRGGSWNLNASYCFVSRRNIDRVTIREYAFGLRLARN